MFWFNWYIITLGQVRYGSSQVRVLKRPAVSLVAIFTLMMFVRKIYSEQDSIILGDRYATRGPYLDRVLPVPDIRGKNYADTLAAIAINKTVILAVVDDSQEIAVRNFYQSSIVPLGLSNTLFVSTSTTGCNSLWTLHIPCFVYGNAPGGAAVYNTAAFLAKMNVRTNYTLRTLELGYSILQTDTDIIYLKNPFPYFNCKKCPIEAMQDGIGGYINAGFVYIRANNITVDVYRAMLQKTIQAPTSEDQRNLNNIMISKKLSYRVLDAKQFIRGKDYYEEGGRNFKSSAKDCPECVAIHNNWIVSTPAKVGYSGNQRLGTKPRYRKISNIRRTKALNLNASRLGLQLSLRNILKSSVGWRMKM